MERTVTALLAHTGAGSAWQAPLALVSMLIGALFLLLVARVVTVRRFADLILPVAAIAVASWFAWVWSDVLSDQVGWAIPVGVIGLAGVLWFAATPQTFTRSSPATIGIVTVAAMASVALSGPLTDVLHPPPVFVDVTTLPVPDDVAVTIVTPTLGETVAGPVVLRAEVRGGTVGGQRMDPVDAPDDPEELGVLRVFTGATLLQVAPREACTSSAPCTTVTWNLHLEPGTHTLLVEFLTATGSSFRPSVFASTVVTVRQ